MKMFNHQLLVIALLAAAATGMQAQTVEYFWDSDPGVGKGTVLQTFEGSDATIATDLDAGTLSAGIHTLGLRALNNGWFSQTYQRQFYVPPQTEQITRIEYSWDTIPALGSGTALTFTAGSTVNLTEQLSVEGLDAGIHALYVQALAGEGHHSQTYKRQFYIPPVEETIQRIEYGWDVAPAFGQGTALTFKAGATVDLTDALATDSLTAGIHTLYLQAMSTNYRSQTYSRTFYVPATPHVVEAVEYYFDEDPGVGMATPMAAATKGDSLVTSFEVDTEGLTDGVHHIGLRTLTDGTWSSTITRQFLVNSVKENEITRLEYFWNDDPGEGNGVAVDITPGEEVTIEFEADMTDLGPGPHTLGLRAKAGSEGWSGAWRVSGIEFEGWDVLQDYLNSLTDTEDVYADGVYSRQFLNRDWHALYVPFSLNYSDWYLHFDVARINAFYQYDDDEDGVVDRQVLEAILVKPGNGSLKPNHPYLIRAKSKGTFSFNVGSARAVEEELNSVSCSTLEAKYTFTGNYSNLTGLKTDERYRLRGGSLSIPETDDEVLPPYRWYLTIDDLGNQLQTDKVRLRILGDDEATAIDSQLFDEGELVGHRKVYDLQGRRVNVSEDTPLRQLPRGIYIINNKKYIAK